MKFENFDDTDLLSYLLIMFCRKVDGWAEDVRIHRTSKRFSTKNRMTLFCCVPSVTYIIIFSFEKTVEYLVKKEYSNMLFLVQETRMLPQCQEDIGNRKGL